MFWAIRKSGGYFSAVSRLQRELVLHAKSVTLRPHVRFRADVRLENIQRWFHMYFKHVIPKTCPLETKTNDVLCG